MNVRTRLNPRLFTKPHPRLWGKSLETKKSRDWFAKLCCWKTHYEGWGRRCNFKGANFVWEQKTAAVSPVLPLVLSVVLPLLVLFWVLQICVGEKKFAGSLLRKCSFNGTDNESVFTLLERGQIAKMLRSNLFHNVQYSLKGGLLWHWMTPSVILIQISQNCFSLRLSVRGDVPFLSIQQAYQGMWGRSII